MQGSPHTAARHVPACNIRVTYQQDLSVWILDEAAHAQSHGTAKAGIDVEQPGYEGRHAVS